jgi:hypothetical protein
MRTFLDLLYKSLHDNYFLKNVQGDLESCADILTSGRILQ